MSDPNLTMQRQIQALQIDLERLRKADAGDAYNTYTPTYTGGSAAGVTTYFIQEGEYVCNGRIVFANGRINWSGATGTGEARVSLPFVISNQYRTTGSLFIDGVTFANSTPQILMVPGQQYFTMYSPLTNSSPTVVSVEAAGLIIWQVTYLI